MTLKKDEFYFSDETDVHGQYEDIFTKLFEFLTKQYDTPFGSIISVSLVSLERSRELNSTYRGVDKVADIITFAYLDDEKERQDDGQKIDLGEMIISPSAVKERAEAINNDFKSEMIYLFIHGFLHLQGFDHVDDIVKEKEMFDTQDQLFERYMEESDMDNNKIKQECIKALDLSYSPYSKFKVGAVVVTYDGEIFLGANIENSAYGLCMCAERNAIYNAYLHGIKKEDIELLCLIASSPKLVSPCGSCRQVMSELLNPNTKVILWTLEGAELETSVQELLPYSFDAGNLASE